MDWKKYVEPLERNECGQFTDSKVKEIENRIEMAMEVIFEDYNFILPYDIEFIAHRTIAHIASMETVKLGAKMNSQKPKEKSFEEMLEEQ